MLKKIFEKVKKFMKENNQMMKAVVAAMIFAYYNLPVTVYASGDAAYLKPLNALKTVLLALVGTAGIIVFIFGIVKLAESIQNTNNGGAFDSWKLIGAGGLMASASVLLALFAG